MAKAELKLDKGKDANRRRSMQGEARRQQILDAAIDSIATRGYADTTLATVAKHAGISQPLLVFHFKTKDALLTEAFRHLSEHRRRLWQTAVQGLEADPLARICALLRVDFQRPVCTRKTIAAWHAFYGEARARPNYSKICGDHDSEHLSIVQAACQDMVSAGRSAVADPSQMASMIGGLSDGMWSWLLFDPRFDRVGALSTLRQLLVVLFPQDASRIAELLPLPEK